MTLAYHLVNSRFYAGITRVSPRAFAEQMNYLCRQGFCSCLPAGVARTAESNEKKSICITFDDAYQCVYEHAYPVMESLGMRGTVFVIAGYVGRTNAWDARLSKPVRHMGWDSLRDLLAAGWEIGSHSMTHAALTVASADAIRREVSDSKKLLEDRLGCAVRAFSYPFGVLSARLVHEVREAGYEVAYGMHIPPPLRGAVFSPYNRGRIAVYLTDGRRSFAKKVRGECGPLHLLVQRMVNFASRGTILVKS